MLSVFDEIRRNKKNSYILVGSYILIIGILGSFVSFVWTGSLQKIDLFTGFMIAIIISTIYSLIMLKSGDKMILSMAGAKPVSKKEYPFLYNTVEGLSLAAGLKNPPKCYVIKDSALNAFATGPEPEKSAIAVTTGLLDKMNRQELEGVIAHEMSHIKNYDIKYMMLVTVLVGLVTLISEICLRSVFYSRGGRDRDGKAQIILLVIGLVFAIAGPIIGQIVKFAVSRQREYLADAGAVQLTRYPNGLKNALIKIKNDPDPLIEKANKATANLFISTPFRKKQSFLTKLFSTHPPLEDRIAKIEKM